MNATPNVRETSAVNDDGIDLIAVWRVLWAYRYLVAVTTAVFGAVAVALALAATPVYRAEVVVTEVRGGGMNDISALAGQLGGLASLAGVTLPSTRDTFDARPVLESRRLAEEFIKRNELLGVIFEKSDRPPTLWLGVMRFRDGIVSIGEDRRKGTLTVAIEWTDPRLAAEWANGYVALANELIRARTIEESTRNIEYLNDQIARTNVVELQQVMYNLIETETKSLMLANARRDYAFNIIDPAVVPELRIRPRRTVMVLVGLSLGFLLGLAAAVAHNVWVERRSSS